MSKRSIVASGGKRRARESQLRPYPCDPGGVMKEKPKPLPLTDEQRRLVEQYQHLPKWR